MSQLDVREQRISDHLVRLIQILFGLVIAQSFILHRELILHPISADGYVALLALLNVYLMTVLSWIDWHTTIAHYPYDLNLANTRRRAEFVKLLVDLLIVAAYAFALLTVVDIHDDASAPLTSYLGVFPIVYLLYLLAGIARSTAARATASHYRPILVFLGAFSVLLTTYSAPLRVDSLTVDPLTRNTIYVLFVLLFTIGYRYYRARYRAALRRIKKNQGLRIGVDVDGVLADQIRGIVPRIKHRHGVYLAPQAVDDWRKPVAETDIAREILLAMETDSDYVRSMRPHPGAVAAMRLIGRNNTVVVITARPTSALELTEEWLSRHGIPYDELISTKEGNKSLYNLDLLVDDYLGNIKDFTEQEAGIAILIDRPWNRDQEARQHLLPLVEQGAVFVLPELEDATEVVDFARALKALEQADGDP